MAIFLQGNKFNYITVTLIIDLLVTGSIQPCSCGRSIRSLPIPEYTSQHIPELYDDNAADLSVIWKNIYGEDQNSANNKPYWLSPRLGRKKNHQEVDLDDDQYEQGFLDNESVADVIMYNPKSMVPTEEDTRTTGKTFTPRLGRNLREEKLKTMHRVSRQEHLMSKLAKEYFVEIFK